LAGSIVIENVKVPTEWNLVPDLCLLVLILQSGFGQTVNLAEELEALENVADGR
jgi:hypothetical protein